MFTIRLNPRAKSTLAKIGNWVGQFSEVIRESETKKPMVRALGKGIEEHFASERVPGYHWQQLTQATQNVRIARGFNPSHPILTQTGSLRAMAAGTMSSYSTITKTASAGGVRFTGAITTLGFRASISGDKVANQYGGNLGYGMHLPARPFWHISSTIAGDMRDALQEEAMKRWVARKKA
jgi:hypothetical protein